MSNRSDTKQMLFLWCIVVLGGLGMSLSPAYAETPAPAAATAVDAGGTDAAQVMYLGDIKVTGQKVILAALQQIKIALARPFDSSKAREDDIVCRISSNTGFREHQYLICATNKWFAERRFASQNRLLAAESAMGSNTADASMNSVILLEHVTAENPNHILHMPIDASKFEALLQKIPLPTAQPDDEQGTSGSTSP